MPGLNTELHHSRMIARSPEILECHEPCWMRHLLWSPQHLVAPPSQKIQGPQELICDWDSVPYELLLFGPTYFINSVAGGGGKKKQQHSKG